MSQKRTAGVATGLTLLIPITLSTMAIVLLTPVLPMMQAEFAHVPNADYFVPMVLTMPALCVALLSPVAGVFGDFFGRRRLLLVAFVVYGVVGVAPIFLKSLPLILATRAVVGIAEALIMTLTTTLIADYFHGAARNRWLAAQTAVASISALILFNLGGVLGHFGWRGPFWVYTAAFAMFAATLAFTWEPEGDSPEEAESHGADWAGFPWRRMAGFVAITIFGSVFFYTMQIQSAPGLAAHGVTDSAKIGFYTSIASLGVPLGTLVYGRFARRPAPILLIFEFAALSVGFVIMSKATGVWGFLAGCALNQFGAGLLLPTLLVWSVSQLEFSVRARGTGIWQSAFAFGQFLCPIVVAFLTRRSGDLFATFGWLGYVAGAAALVALAASTLRRGTLARQQA